VFDSTAILNPLSSTYCRFSSSKSSEPTLIPLLLNNTIPSKLTYSLTSLSDPSSTREITIPVSKLIKPRKHHLPHHNPLSIQDASSEEDDDLALAAQWSLVPSSPKTPSSSSKRHHPLPPSSSSLIGSSSSSNSANDNPLDLSDPFSSLSPSQSLYYLPITTPGQLQLVSILDSDGHPIRIRRKRSSSNHISSSSSTSTSSYESTLITECPQAGFDLGGQEPIEHRCLIDPNSFVEEESFSLGLKVKGNEPLKVRWSSKEGDTPRGGGVKKFESLEGIVGFQGEGEEGIVRVPLNVSLSRVGRTSYTVEKVIDRFGNEVSYGASSSGGAPLLEGTQGNREIMVHKLPEIMFVGECARGDEVQLLDGQKQKLRFKLSGLEEEEKYKGFVGMRFTPSSSSEGAGWEKEIEVNARNGEVEVDKAGIYEITRVRSQYCQGSVLVPSSCTLILQPLPTLSTTFTPLHDLCSSPTGLLTTLHLTGVAPFTVSYSLTKLTGRPSSTHHTHRLSHSRDELKIEPGVGEWEVRFTQIEDRFYKKLRLNGAKGEFSKRIKVEEVAEAKWREREKTVHSCEGGTVGVEVQLKVSHPFDLCDDSGGTDRGSCFADRAQHLGLSSTRLSVRNLKLSKGFKNLLITSRWRSRTSSLNKEDNSLYLSVGRPITSNIELKVELT